MKAELSIVPVSLKLDLGAGKGRNTPDGFTPVDIVRGNGIQCVDLTKRWPWKSNSVDEARSIYLIHYLTPEQRVHFVNELWRVLKPDARCEIHTPHWCAGRAYGDPRVQWPPVSEWWYAMLSKRWRSEQNSTIEGYKCDFDAGVGYGMHQALLSRNPEFQQNALTFYKEAAQELVVTLTALK